MSAYAFLAELLSEKYDVDPEAIRPEATLTELGLDSRTVVELLFDVEDEFGIKIPQESGTFQTLAEAAALVGELVRARRWPPPETPWRTPASLSKEAGPRKRAYPWGADSEEPKSSNKPIAPTSSGTAGGPGRRPSL